MIGYLTKDKCGTICLYREVPTKFNECWNNEYGDCIGDCIEICPSDLPEDIVPEWEDEEPIKVRLHFEKDEPKNVTQDIKDIVHSYSKEEEYQRRKAFGKLSRRQELSERSKYNMFTFKKKDFTFKGFHVIEKPSYRWGPTSDELKPLAKKLGNNEYLTFRWNAEIWRLIRKDGIGRKQFFCLRKDRCHTWMCLVWEQAYNKYLSTRAEFGPKDVYNKKEK